MRNLLYITARGLGVTLSAVILLVSVSVLFAIGVFMLTPPGWMVWPLLIGYGTEFRRRLNRRRAALVLSHVRQAVRLSLPMPRRTSIRRQPACGLAFQRSRPRMSHWAFRTR